LLSAKPVSFQIQNVAKLMTHCESLWNSRDTLAVRFRDKAPKMERSKAKKILKNKKQKAEQMKELGPWIQKWIYNYTSLNDE